MVLGERKANENDDRLCEEWTEQADRASSTQRAPSAVSSGDLFCCLDVCVEKSMLGKRQAGWREYDRVDGVGGNLSRLPQAAPHFLYFCIACLVTPPGFC